MTAIITTNLRLKNAAFIKQTLSDASNSLYMFAAKPTSWPDDTNPVNPTDSALFERTVRDEMISLKKVSSTEITQSIYRVNWTTGKFYDIYRDDYDGVKLNGVDIDTGSPVARDGLINANFYVLTDDFNVYKCIWNGNRAASTVKPTGNLTSIFQTSDGYRWKYMYSINSSDALKFISSNFMPVASYATNPGSSSPYYNQYLVQSSAVPGKLDVAEIVSSGDGYTPNATLPLSFIGDGSGAAGTVTTNGSGQVINVTITSGGSGYTYAYATVIGSSAVTATLNLIIPPKGGHGSDPVSELEAVYVTISSTIGDDLSEDTLKENQYRILGLVLNPYVYGTSTILTSPTASALRSITIAGGISGSFTDDEALISSGTPNNRGNFIAWSGFSKTLKYLRNKLNVGPDFVVSQSVSGQTSGAAGIVTALNNPEVDTSSGEILYVETRRPIFRSISQKEDIRITIES